MMTVGLLSRCFSLKPSPRSWFYTHTQCLSYRSLSPRPSQASRCETPRGLDEISHTQSRNHWLLRRGIPGTGAGRGALHYHYWPFFQTSFASFSRCLHTHLHPDFTSTLVFLSQASCIFCVGESICSALLTHSAGGCKMGIALREGCRLTGESPDHRSTRKDGRRRICSTSMWANQRHTG